MKRIPCLVIVYHDFPIVRACLDFLAKHREQLDIVVVENFSEHTNREIKPYVLNLLQSGSIQKYFLFDKNISMNAFEVVLQEGGLNLAEADYVMVTDGDLIVEQGDWLGEQRAILERHPDVFACGMTLDMRNLPVRAFSDAANWVHTGTECGDHFLASTGLWLLLMRAEQFHQFVAWHKEHDYSRFSDTLLRKYCKRVLGKKWARTKQTKAYHLTWDRYMDLDHPYTQIKTQNSLRKLFHHHRYCGCTLYTRDKTSRHFPVARYIKGLKRSFSAAVLDRLSKANAISC
jgi:hypothetical protein